MASRPPTDLRKISRDNQRRLFGAVLLVLVGVGGGLIALTYGAPAGLLGVLCLLAGAGVLGLLWLIFTLLGHWANSGD
jgi:protein-S-isoprenylcysteine O-methyltransferase Ste14